MLNGKFLEIQALDKKKHFHGFWLVLYFFLGYTGNKFSKKIKIDQLCLL